MRAVVLTHYGEPEDLKLRDVEDPMPRDGEVLVETHAASINDWDWGLVRGSPSYIRLLCGLRRPRVLVPGVDLAGRVVGVGTGVHRLREGDRVYGDLSASGFGAFAEYARAPESALEVIPEGMNYAEAAALPHAATLAVQSFEKARLKAEDRVLINGAGGGVGTLGVQIARALGVSDITGVDSAGKLDTMSELGCSRAIDYRVHDFTAIGERFDLILDCRTTRGVLPLGRALRPGGRYVTIGGRVRGLLDVAILGRPWGAAMGVKFSVLGHKPNKGLDRVDGLWRAGALRPIIEDGGGLDDVPQAIRRFGGGLHVGKIVVRMRDE